MLHCIAGLHCHVIVYTLHNMESNKYFKESTLMIIITIHKYCD